MVDQIPPLRLVPEALTAEGAALLERPSFVWEELGERHRIGGAPELRNSEWPSCPSCAEPMTFYAQLDGLPGSTQFDLADAGLIYVYVCFGCFEVAAALDSP